MKKSLILSIFSIFLLSACGITDASNDVTIESLLARKSSESGISKLQQNNKEEPDSIKNAKDKNDQEEYFTILKDNVGVFDLEVKLSNPKKESITALEFECSSDDVYVQLEDNHGVSNWYPIKDYPVVAWGGTNLYERTFVFAFGEEFTNEMCKIKVNDIQINNTWQSKYLKNNTINVCLADEEPFTIIGQKSNDDNYFFFKYQISKNVTNVVFENVESLENDIYKIKYGEDLIAEIYFVFDEYEGSYIYKEPVIKSKYTMFGSSLYWWGLDYEDNNELDVTVDYLFSGPKGIDVNLTNPSFVFNNFELDLIKYEEQPSYENNKITMRYFFDAPPEKMPENFIQGTNMSAVINGREVSFEIWTCGYTQKQIASNKYSLVYSPTSGNALNTGFYLAEFFTPSENEGEYIIESFPITKANLAYGFSIKKGYAPIDSGNSSGDVVFEIIDSPSFAKMERESLNKQSLYTFLLIDETQVGAYDIIFNEFDKSVTLKKVSVNEKTYSYFEGSSPLCYVVASTSIWPNSNNYMIYDQISKKYIGTRMSIDNNFTYATSIPYGSYFVFAGVTDILMSYFLIEIPEADYGRVYINCEMDPITFEFSYTIA